LVKPLPPPTLLFYPYGEYLRTQVYSALFLQELRLSSVSVRLEVLNCQKRWFEELAGLGENESL